MDAKRYITAVLTGIASGCTVQQSEIRGSPPPAPAVHARPEKFERSESGVASVYADRFHGRKTASGEIFDQNELTAASRTLPLGSMVKVTNRDTGKSTVVKITDRGPYVKGRIIDLSKAAARQIAMDTAGIAPVTVERIDGHPKAY